MSVSADLKKVMDGLYQDGEFVICVCSNATFLVCKPLPGDIVKCICGNDYSKAVAARKKLHTEYEKEEVEAMNEKKAADAVKASGNGGNDDLIPDKCPGGIAMAVHKTFKSVIEPAFKDANGKAEWDEDVLGEDPLEAMKMFNGHYDKMDRADKTKYLDAFRKETTSDQIIHKLVETMKFLNNLTGSGA